LNNNDSGKNRLYEIQKKARKKLYFNTYIQIIDNEKAIVENCRHIAECSDVLVKLVTADFQIEIWGQSLTISDYNKENVIVNGRISSIEFIPRKRADKNAV
jgi:sporulation protein YqfC